VNDGGRASYTRTEGEKMRAYRVQMHNARGKKTADFIQFAADHIEAAEICASRFRTDDETVTRCAEVNPSGTFEAALWAFGALVQEQQLAELVRQYGETNKNSGTPTRRVHMQAWPVKIVEGRKYYNVDVGSSGKYIVTKDTGDIYGIKGYGVIHTGHHFGTLATVGAWQWGGYRAIPA